MSGSILFLPSYTRGKKKNIWSELESNPGPFASQATALTTRPWLLGPYLGFILYLLTTAFAAVGEDSASLSLYHLDLFQYINELKTVFWGEVFCSIRAYKASPQATWLRIFFYSKTSSVAPPWGIWMGFKPMTSLSWVVRSTAVLQPLPNLGVR